MAPILTRSKAQMQLHKASNLKKSKQEDDESPPLTERNMNVGNNDEADEPPPLLPCCNNPSSATMMLAPPVGLKFGNKKTIWKIGKKLGSGACAAVHLVETEAGIPTEYAIKLVPIPLKTTKKANTEPETNVRLLHHESVAYQVAFADLQGELIPKLPHGKGPPAYGEVPADGKVLGYKFLTMERMESPLSQVVPLLIEKSKKSSKIPFGAVAAQLLECIQAIHDRKQIVVDVKPENFMLASGSSKNLAARLRILDLGMVQPWTSYNGRCPNVESDMAGTPIYASINVHNKSTPSRRDDLEALGYLIAELLMQIALNKVSPDLLPWSQGKSDDEVGKIKKDQVNDPNSVFYRRMGEESVVKVFCKYLDEVRSYDYESPPDYKSLKKTLLALDVPKVDTKPAAKVAKSAPAKKAS